MVAILEQYICHAWTADKYFLTTPTKTGLKGIPAEASGLSMFESVPEQGMEEWNGHQEVIRFRDGEDITEKVELSEAWPIADSIVKWGTWC